MSPALRRNNDYPGPSASKTYDRYFEESHPVPHLKSHIPQGLSTWSRWDGKDDLLLIASYSPRTDERACLIGLNARTGTRVGTARVDASHVGGVAIFEQHGWAYLSSEHKYRVRRYALDALKDAITRSAYLRQDGGDIKVFGASFLASHPQSGTLWAGRFDVDGPDYMHSYEVANDGSLRARDGLWQVPRRTQGLAVTNESFIDSCSYGRNNRSRLYVVRRGKGSAELDEARPASFLAPSMSEGVTVCGDDVYVVYESGARVYNAGPDKPRNSIGRLHRASLEALVGLLHPAARTAEHARSRGALQRRSATAPTSDALE